MKKSVAVLLSSVLSLSAMAAPLAAADGRLEPNEYLFPRQYISEDCYYWLTMQGDGNLVTYRHDGSAVWDAGTQNFGGGYAVMQTDGNFVVRDWNDQPAGFWTGTQGFETGESVCDQWRVESCYSSPELMCTHCVQKHWLSYSNPHKFLAQQKDGNLVVYYAKDFPETSWWYGGWQSQRSGPQLFASCSPHDLKTHVDPGFNRQGSDYKSISIPVPRHSWCGYYCALENQCRAYTYVPQGSGGVCWLKSAVPPLTPFTGAVSGQVIGR
jgi:hypothetical protein